MVYTPHVHSLRAIKEKLLGVECSYTYIVVVVFGLVGLFVIAFMTRRFGAGPDGTVRAVSILRPPHFALDLPHAGENLKGCCHPKVLSVRRFGWSSTHCITRSKVRKKEMITDQSALTGTEPPLHARETPHRNMYDGGRYEEASALTEIGKERLSYKG